MKIQKRKLWTYWPIAGYLFLFVFVALFLYALAMPRITLAGGASVQIDFGQEYIEPGYLASWHGEDLTEWVSVTDNIDKDRLGKYEVLYELVYGDIHKTARRKVEIIDREAPVIVLAGDSPGKFCPNREYIEEGYSATDNYDGDITEMVERTRKIGVVEYVVRDSSGNRTIATRILEQYINPTPDIRLNGDSVMQVVVGTKYVEPGYFAEDKCDGDISDKVSVSGRVDGGKLGTYLVTYTVQNSFGVTTATERKVEVVPKPRDERGVIYLTFDDGSSRLTEQILDILKSEGVKATFFVVNTNNSYNSLIQRAHDEGHTIGLHSYSHQYGQIYASENAFFDDLSAISSKVQGLIGVAPNITRFPGGSSNTVSSFNPGIMSRLTAQMKARGFLYFDWNVDSRDATGAGSAEAIYRNVINSLSKDRSNVVLMHDAGNKTHTVQALRDIIRFGKNNGYSFGALSSASGQVKHRVNN